MDIHKPKAARNWREFVIEIGTIICGILIALSLEQGIEWLHWREQVADADERLGAEVERNLVGSYARVILQSCYDKRLAVLRDRLLEPGVWEGMPLTMSPLDGKATITPLQAAGILSSAMPPVYITYFNIWPQDAWSAAIADGVTPHMQSERAADYTALYRGFQRMNDIQIQEQPIEARLSVLSRSIANISDEDRTHYLEMIGELNMLNLIAAVSARQNIALADKEGLRVKQSHAERMIAFVRGDPRFTTCLDPVKIPLDAN